MILSTKFSSWATASSFHGKKWRARSWFSMLLSLMLGIPSNDWQKCMLWPGNSVYDHLIVQINWLNLQCFMKTRVHSIPCCVCYMAQCYLVLCSLWCCDIRYGPWPLEVVKRTPDNIARTPPYIRLYIFVRSHEAFAHTQGIRVIPSPSGGYLGFIEPYLHT